MTNIVRTLAVLIAAITCCRGAFAQSATTIDARATVTLPAGSPVTLKQIATIAGPDADRLETMVILHADQARATESDGTRTISRDALREALDNGGANWARTLLRCKSVTITFTASAAPVTAPATSSSTPLPLSPAPVLPPSNPRSLRALILRTLAESAGLGADTSAVTLRTDNLSDTDQQLLAAPIPASWKCSIQVLGATPSGRTPLKIEAFEGDRVALSKTITVEALVRREVLVAGAAGGIAREQIIAQSDLRTETRALPVNESARLASVTADQVVGSAAKRRIDAGRPILPGDIVTTKPSIIVHRGDDVWVSCLSGGMMIKTKAKSLSVARDGETVQLQLDGSKKVVTARMNGIGKAIIDVDGQRTAPAAESQKRRDDN